MLLNSADRQFLTFFLDESLYGISVDYIKEVNNIAQITLASGGSVQLRGKTFPLVDLRVIFQLPERLFPASNNLLIVAIEGQSYGVLVDGIDSVLRLDSNQIQNDTLSPFLEGRASYYKQTISIINIMACLNTPAGKLVEKTVLSSAS